MVMPLSTWHCSARFPQSLRCEFLFLGLIPIHSLQNIYVWSSHYWYDFIPLHFHSLWDVNIPVFKYGPIDFYAQPCNPISSYCDNFHFTKFLTPLYSLPVNHNLHFWPSFFDRSCIFWYTLISLYSDPPEQIYCFVY